MADEKLNVGINFNVTGNADAAGALKSLGTAAAETAAEFDAAAVSAKAMADAVTAAQALSALGIKAKAPGVVNESGQGLVTVAAEEQANAQAILNKLGLEATAVTSEQAAATARLAEAQATAAAATTEQAAASTEGAVAAERLAVAETEAGTAGEAMRAEAGGATSALGGMWTQLIAVIAALEAYSKAKEFISTGIGFNAAIESARLGIAASVNAVSDLTDAQGKALEGQEKFGAATALADDQIQKLFADSARTSTTVQQLVTTYQSAIAVGLEAGANLDQIRRLTTDAALAAGALNIPYTQLSVTLVQLLEGHTRVTNRLAQALGINQRDLATWKEKGTLVDELLSRFGQYESLSTRIQGTWRGIASNIKEFLQQFAGASTAGAFSALETGIKGQLGRVFDFDTGKLSSNIQGAANLLREGLGGGAQLIVDLVGRIIDGLESMGTWFENNKEKAEGLGRGMLDILTSTGRIIAGMTEILVKIAAWAAGSVLLQATLRTIGDIVGFIADHIGAITAAVAALATIGNLAAIDIAIPAFIAALNPITLLIAAIVALTGAVEYHRITQERATAAAVAARQATIDQATSTATLVGQYEALTKEIASGTLTHAALARAREQLKTVTDELVKVSPAYRDAIGEETDGIRKQGEAVDALYESQLRQLEAQRDTARASVESLKAQESALSKEEHDAIDAIGRPSSEGGAAIADAHLADVTSRLGEVRAQLKSAVADARSAGAAIFGAISAKVKAEQDALATVHKKPGGDGTPEKGLDAAQVNAEIERMKAEAATIERALQGQLERNELSYAEYFDRLNATELSALDVQIAGKEKLLAKTTDPKERAKLGGDIEKLQEEENQTVERNAAKRLTLEQQYDKQRTAAAVQNLKDQGQAELAYDLEFEESHRALVARATAEGDAATLAAIDNEYAIGKARMEADKAAKQAAAVTSETEGTVRGVQAGVENGAISEARGRELIIAAYQREQIAIEGALRAAEALAKLSPTPENIAKVDTLAKQYGTVEKSIAQASDTSLHLRQQIAGALSSDLTEFFTRTIEGAHSVGEAFAQLAASVIRSIEQIISQLLAAQITKGIAGLLGLGGNSLAGASLGDIANAGIAHAASGGHVSGPGGPTSDMVPAMLSAGEYVVRASAVDSLGVGFFDAVNAGSMRTRPHAYGGLAHFARGGIIERFASGGHVGSAPGVGPEQEGSGSSHHLHVSVDPGLIVETMRSPAGHKVTIETLQRNPKAARQSMRIP